MLKLVDKHDSESCAARRVGSNPIPGTNKCKRLRVAGLFLFRRTAQACLRQARETKKTRPEGTWLFHFDFDQYGIMEA